MRNPETAARAKPSEGLPIKKHEPGRSAVPEAKSAKGSQEMNATLDGGQQH
jgi:hypothetical protein